MTQHKWLCPADSDLYPIQIILQYHHQSQVRRCLAEGLTRESLAHSSCLLLRRRSQLLLEHKWSWCSVSITWLFFALCTYGYPQVAATNFKTTKITPGGGMFSTHKNYPVYGSSYVSVHFYIRDIPQEWAVNGFILIWLICKTIVVVCIGNYRVQTFWKEVRNWFIVENCIRYPKDTHKRDTFSCLTDNQYTAKRY